MLNRFNQDLVNRSNHIIQLSFFALLLIGFSVFLTGCNYPGYAPSAQDTSPVPPTGTKVRLPDTWTPEPITSTPENTPTITHTETQNTTNTPTLTDTPIASPATTTAPTTAGVLSPTPTVDYLAAPYPDCRYIATKAGIRLQIAPFIDLYRVLPTMEPGKAYTAVVDKPTYSLLLDGDLPVGWIDYRLVALEREGVDCLTRRDHREIIEFPGLCFFSPFEKTTGFSDPELSQESHDLIPDNLYILLYQTADVYFTAFGHAGPSVYISRDEVEIQGECDDVPVGGQIITETAMYSIPDSIEGTVLVPLPVGQFVFIQKNTASGDPPPNGSSSGNWVQIRIPTNAGGYDGWCWSEFLEHK